MDKIQTSRRQLKEAEKAFVEAAREHANGAPNGARYQERLESLVAAYETLSMVDSRLS